MGMGGALRRVPGVLPIGAGGARSRSPDSAIAADGPIRSGGERSAHPFLAEWRP